jgi:hypothetical protein
MKKSYQSTPIFTLLLSILSIILSANQVGAAKLRVVAYNVACGQWATPERIAEELKALKPDIVLLSEVPKANRGKKVKDWSQRLADALDLDHVHVGVVSSAGHKSPKWGDPTGNYGGKFKSILSRTPSHGRQGHLSGRKRLEAGQCRTGGNRNRWEEVRFVFPAPAWICPS